MDRRSLLAGVLGATVSSMSTEAATSSNSYLELKIWRLHNTHEDQSARVAEYLQHGLSPALTRAGAKLQGAFANLIGENGPYYVSLAEFPSLGGMQETLTKLASDPEHQKAAEKLDSGNGLPFVRVESSLLRSFDRMPQVTVPEEGGSRSPRIFELRTYESQTFVTLTRKVAMFNGGEMQIFERLGMHPVFFGQTIVGPRQPNLMYMLSYDDLASRDRLWKAFGSDPEWKKLSGQPELKDAEIVANISNVILRPLAFSPIR